MPLLAARLCALWWRLDLALAVRIGAVGYDPCLGPERLAYACPWQPLRERGLPIIGGSDAPVEVGDPRIEFLAAIERARPDGSRDEDWCPQYAVSLH